MAPVDPSPDCVALPPETREGRCRSAIGFSQAPPFRIFGLRDLERRHPARGWVRLDDTEVAFVSNPTRDHARSSLDTIFRILPISRTMHFPEGLDVMRRLLKVTEKGVGSETGLSGDIAWMLNDPFENADTSAEALDLIDYDGSRHALSTNGRRVMCYLESHELIEGKRI